MPNKINVYTNDRFQQTGFLDRNVFNVIDYGVPERIINTTARLSGLYLYLNTPTINFESYTYPDNVINARRLNDVEQFYILKRFGIKMPDIIWSEQTAAIYTLLDPNKKYLVKYFGHARSLGQTIITKDKFIPLLDDARDLPEDKFESVYLYKEGVVRDGEEHMLQRNIRSGNCFLQDFIVFLNEYRFLAFNTMGGIKLIVEKREGYGVLDERERIHEVCYTSENEKKNVLFENIGSKLLEVMLYLNLPVISFDVYINSENDWGCFEFSTEYGVKYDGYYNLLSKYTTDAYLAFAARASLTIN